MVLKDKNRAFWTIVFLVIFPTSFFFGSLYTESLFFLFTVSFFYFLKKGNFLAAGVFGFFAALTRFVGVFLIVPALIYFFAVKRRAKPISNLLTALTPLLGLGTYSYYLWKVYGDAFLFFSSQTAFSAGRSTSLVLLPQVYYRYFKIFLTSAKNFQYFVAAVEFSIFTLVFLGVLWFVYKVWRERNWDLTALSTFSFLNILIPTLTGTFLSTPRFSLLSLSFFVFLAQIKNGKLKLGIALIFILLHTVLLAFFIQGYFVS